MPINIPPILRYHAFWATWAVLSPIALMGFFIIGYPTLPTIADDMWTAVMAEYPGGSAECQLSAMLGARDAYGLLSDHQPVDYDRPNFNDRWKAELAVRMVAESEQQPPECLTAPP